MNIEFVPVAGTGGRRSGGRRAAGDGFGIGGFAVTISSLGGVREGSGEMLGRVWR